MPNDFFSLYRETAREAEFMKAYLQLVQMHALDRETGIPAEVLVDHTRLALLSLRISLDTIEKNRINVSLRDNAKVHEGSLDVINAAARLLGGDTRGRATVIREQPGQPAHYPKRALGDMSAKIQDAMDQATQPDTRPFLDNKSPYIDDAVRYGLGKGGEHAAD